MNCPVCNKEIANTADCPQCGCSSKFLDLIEKQSTLKSILENNGMNDIFADSIVTLDADISNTIEEKRKEYWDTMPWFVIQNTTLQKFDIKVYKSHEKEHWGEEVYYSCGYHEFVGIKIPYGITKVGDNAFANINILNFSVEIPDTVKTIGHGAFFASSLRSINIPHGVVEIGAYSFCNNKITNLFLPSSVEIIGEGAFCNAFYTTGGLTLHCNNNNFRIESDCLIENGSNKMVSYVGEDREIVVVPYGIECVANYAFAYLRNLRTVMGFPGLKISENAFYGCGEIDIFSLFYTQSWKFNATNIPIIAKKENNFIKWQNSEILYVYKGHICCHKYNHKVIQTTAILHNKTDNEIELNVEYCTECKKFILEYTVFEQYRNRYGVLVGNFRMVVNGEFDGEYDLAEESPLMLSGYNVSQRDGYTSRERHYILARIIHDGIMEKGEVIRYLSYFIRKNGAKRGNELALSKWEEDLAFAQEYDKSTQPKTIISDIRKY